MPQEIDQSFSFDQANTASETPWQAASLEAYRTMDAGGKSGGSNGDTSGDRSDSKSDDNEEEEEEGAHEMSDPFQKKDNQEASSLPRPETAKGADGAAPGAGPAGGRRLDRHDTLPGTEPFGSLSLFDSSIAPQLRADAEQMETNPSGYWADTVASYLQVQGSGGQAFTLLQQAIMRSEGVEKMLAAKGVEWTQIHRDLGNNTAYTFTDNQGNGMTLAVTREGHVAIDNGKDLSLYVMDGGKAVAKVEFPPFGKPTVTKLNGEANPTLPSSSDFKSTAKQLREMANWHADLELKQEDGESRSDYNKSRRNIERAINPVAARLMNASLQMDRLGQSPQPPRDEFRKLSGDLRFFERTDSHEQFQPRAERLLKLGEELGETPAKPGFVSVGLIQTRVDLADSYVKSQMNDKARPHFERALKDMSDLPRLYRDQRSIDDIAKKLKNLD